MSSSDRDALRTQLAVCFNRLTKGVEDAGKVDKAVLSLKETFYDSMRDLIRTWATRTTISKLPAEVLAMCIGCLPLRDRIVATHVSHAWRAVALAAPDLWSDIIFSPTRQSSPKNVLKMVLDHSGARPIDFEVDEYTHDASQHELLVWELNWHMHRVRSVVWHDCVRSDLFEDPAPMLEVFHTRGDGLDEGFLDGSAGNLRTLRLGTLILPATCPAVATVTDLRCSLPKPDGSEEAAPSQLSRLFAIFPQLRSLSLSSIRPEQATVLRAIRSPCPLSKLRLHTSDGLCDISALHEAWRTAFMKDVSLGTKLESISTDSFAAYLSAVHDLTLKITIDSEKFLTYARFEALSLDGRKHYLELYAGSELNVDAGAAKIGQYLAAAQPSFGQLHSLTVPTAVFAAATFHWHDVDLPSLKKLILVYEERVVSYFDSNASRTRSWCIWPCSDLQPCVERLLSQPVQSLVVDMRRRFADRPPDFFDVRFLLDALRPIAPTSHRSTATRMRIRGISARVADDLGSEFQHLGITYEVEGSSHPTVA